MELLGEDQIGDFRFCENLTRALKISKNTNVMGNFSINRLMKFAIVWILQF